jgi:hypothetical protein
MALVETCKCEECGLQKSFANHWVMIVERKESLLVLPVWDEKKIRRTRHFCGRAHASRFVERWIANPGMALVSDVAGEAESRIVRGQQSEQPQMPPLLMDSESHLDESTLDESPIEPVHIVQSHLEQRQLEQLMMEDEFGDEISSARLVPSPISARCA